MKVIIKSIIITLFTLGLSINVGAQTATIKGRVVNSINNEPLPFVNIIVSGTTTGTTTDENGNFILSGLKPGFMRLEASFVGYKKYISPEIEVSPAKTNFIEIQLEQQKEQIEAVTVKASPFEKQKKVRFHFVQSGLVKLKKVREQIVIFQR